MNKPKFKTPKPSQCPATHPDPADPKRSIHCILTKGHPLGLHEDYNGGRWVTSDPSKVLPACAAVNDEKGWKCELPNGHFGEHSCGDFTWPHSYGEAAPAPPSPPPVACGYSWSVGVLTFRCGLPRGHKGAHATKSGHVLCPAAIPTPPSVTQKLVLHLPNGDVELSEADALQLREQLNGIFGQLIPIYIPTSAPLTPYMLPLHPGIWCITSNSAQ